MSGLLKEVGLHQAEALLDEKLDGLTYTFQASFQD